MHPLKIGTRVKDKKRPKNKGIIKAVQLPLFEDFDNWDNLCSMEKRPEKLVLKRHCELELENNST